MVIRSISLAYWYGEFAMLHLEEVTMRHLEEALERGASSGWAIF